MRERGHEFHYGESPLSLARAIADASQEGGTVILAGTSVSDLLAYAAAAEDCLTSLPPVRGEMRREGGECRLLLHVGKACHFSSTGM